MKTKIETLDFSETTFNEIPKQDNPALTAHFQDNYKKKRILMIVKAEKHHKIGVPHGFTVLDIDNPENIGDRVLGLGVFYEYKDACLFAEAYANKLSQEKETITTQHNKGIAE